MKKPKPKKQKAAQAGKAGKKSAAKAAVRTHGGKSGWCIKCRKRGKRRRAVRYADGTFGSYCADDKRAYMRMYMKKRRNADPKYGQSRGRHRESGAKKA